MARESHIYDLVLLLSRSASDEARERILTEVDNAIANDGGVVERSIDWGTRPLAFEIRHEAEADYHVLQFSGSPALLESLEHSLRIADEVLRFRIIKVVPGTPEVADAAPPVLAGSAAAPAPAPAAAPSGGDESEA